MFIPPFTTKRIKAEIAEISMQGIIQMCEVPESLLEQANQIFLQGIIKETSLPLSEWTIQERYALIGHYIMAQNEGDFDVSETSSYVDYPINSDYPDMAYSFTTEAGLTFTIYPLTTEYILAVERIVVREGIGIQDNNKFSYLIASMAAQIRQEEHEEGDLEALITNRSKELLSLTESEFNILLGEYQRGLEETQHLLNFWVSDLGYVFLAGDYGLQRMKEAGDDLNIPPARFPVYQRIQAITYEIAKGNKRDVLHGVD